MCACQTPVKFDGSFGAYVNIEKDLRIWVHTILNRVFFTYVNRIDAFIF